MSGENLYMKAIHHPERDEQLHSFVQFCTQEIEETHSRLTDLEHDDGSIPDENRDRWNYEKGKLDNLRLIQGMFAQAVMSRQMTDSENR